MRRPRREICLVECADNILSGLHMKSWKMKHKYSRPKSGQDCLMCTSRQRNHVRLVLLLTEVDPKSNIDSESSTPSDNDSDSTEVTTDQHNLKL